MDITFSLTLVFVIITVLASLYAWQRPDIMEKWMMNPYRVAHRKEYSRFITSGFIHQDGMHLLFNMIALFSFGVQMEEKVFSVLYPGAGLTLFGILYIVGIIVSDIPTYLKYKNYSYYNSLGASGGVSAVVFAFILFNPQAKLGLMFIPFLKLPAFLFGALYMFYSIYMSKRGGDNINHDAHLWGALFGIAFSVIVYPPVVNLFMSQILGGSI
ncbi:rhomboid family intramembrane serine protease [Cytophagaceae bacterium DM2B3-1]|uniref:Rhomboid family intramembrane serine protease n=1 Tax=Xanthocytophaga flava TaxID=3048013 RepID=A0ABT7CGF1_9BACT|nr:rhomboid family intramembrane serine protease [Xanthocytophaga flavus]MDJ1492773.1 rhomboid family intramembrane serine protease [Xanthocytophaga flavus]